jgi:Fibronectin type III domain/Kelch motif/Galactose oxidase, central domain
VESVPRRRLALAIATACCAAAASAAIAASPNSWTGAGALGGPRMIGAAAVLPDGRVLVAGGTATGSTAVNTAEIYSPATNSWTLVANMGTARLLATATSLPNGKVLVAGGEANNSPSTAVDTGEVYNPANNTWTPVTNTMSSARARHVAVLLPNGKVLVAGGNGTTDAGTTTADLYDPATNSFSPAAPMGTARALPAIALLTSGRALVAGGTSNLGTPALDSGEVYNPAGNTWTPVANAMPGGARLYPAAATLPNDEALIAGGAPSGTTPALATADVYNGATNRFTAAANSMQSSRIAGLALPLFDGRVLVAGGATSPLGPGTATADLFNPSSGSFSPAAPMGTARVFPAAARLGDGRVLAAGGAQSLASPSVLPSAEIYQPTTIPAAPGGARATPAIGAALVGWQAPASDGGSAVQRYRITISPGGRTVDTPDARLSLLVGGLQNGQSYTFTVTAINAIGSGTPSASTGPVTPTKRILSRLKASPTSFFAAPSGPSVRSSAKRRGKPGTIVSYNLVEPARVTFTVQRAVRGVKRGRRCVKGSKGKRCTRFVAVRGSFAVNGNSGANRFRFTGRVRRHTLARGSYRLIATPQEATGAKGTPVRLKFRVRG